MPQDTDNPAKFTRLKSPIETLEKRCETCSELTIKTPERLTLTLNRSVFNELGIPLFTYSRCVFTPRVI